MSKKVLIIEDEVLIAYHIAEILSGIHIKEVEMAHSYKGALEKMPVFKPDLLIMDINLNEEKDGITLARDLHKISKENLAIIYLTANTNFSKLNEAIEQRPLAILTKPIKKIDLISNVSLFFNEKKEHKISFRSNREQVFLDEKDVLYGKIEDNYLFLFTTSGRHVIRTSIDSFLVSNACELLKQCHRSYLVNPSRVTRLKLNSLFIRDIEIPLSKSFKQELLNHLVVS